MNLYLVPKIAMAHSEKCAPHLLESRSAFLREKVEPKIRSLHIGVVHPGQVAQRSTQQCRRNACVRWRFRRCDTVLFHAATHNKAKWQLLRPVVAKTKNAHLRYAGFQFLASFVEILSLFSIFSVDTKWRVFKIDTYRRSCRNKLWTKRKPHIEVQRCTRGA